MVPSRCSSSDNSRAKAQGNIVSMHSHDMDELVDRSPPPTCSTTNCGVLVVETKIRAQQAELLSTRLTATWKKTCGDCNCDACYDSEISHAPPLDFAWSRAPNIGLSILPGMMYQNRQTATKLPIWPYRSKGVGWTAHYRQCFLI